ncbi:hypothetical protein [Cryobacterium arcticum]|uniref:Restriction endonuclease n=1 Tax=Cryobacterium arcticum TaxID=670052 RepID=A0A317ZP76_9MICO|nr:hypothetical protein [Cryobacterium arcticum]PXA68302.1 hypothetical protein CTB96_16925 [Cryobacterium arcticum]
MTDEIEWLVPPAAVPLIGNNSFVGMPGEARVQDFWQFALGDLRMNNARGYLAEFLVGKALGIEPLIRIEWDSFDLLFGDITIEVKSSAYLQAWDQRRISTLSFSGLKGTRYNPRAPLGGEDPLGKRYNAMVYVFCVQTATTHEAYNPLDVSQWEFHVVRRRALAATGLQSLGIGRVRKLSEGTTVWADLAAKVTMAAVGEARDDDDPDWWKRSL